ncbi:MAG: TIM barrel protein [Candidatus Diapherotrites archaeon]|nr:TIM barrel protein [Candidatus Diapherotrites archaeon]
MVHFGTAGKPISCNGGTLEGVSCVRSLGLDALEVSFTHGVRMGEDLAKRIAERAKKENVKLSVHAPYYTNFLSKEKEKLEASRKRILDSARIAGFLNAEKVVFHIGFYGSYSKEEAFKLVQEELEGLAELVQEFDVGVKLAPETMGKQKTFGTVEEILELSKDVSGVVPTFDFAHVHARGNGCLTSQGNFSSLFDQIESALGKKQLDCLHCHLTGVEHSNGNERRHLNLLESDLDWRGLVDEIIERKINPTIISESPCIEGDAIMARDYFIQRSR